MSDILAVTYDGAVAVTQSDATPDPAGPFAALHTGSGGAIKVTTVKGTAVVLASCPAGVVRPIAVTRVWSTGTTATGVLGLHALPFKGTAT